MRYIEYGEKELNYLKGKDENLKQIIEKEGYIKRKINPDLFVGIVSNIIGQQISMKATETIWQRLLLKCNEITPKVIHLISAEELQSIGITMRKANYLKNIAKEIIEGKLNLEELKEMTDAEVIERLISLNGIGVWTAEMLLIFSLGRMDVLSWNDLGIRRGLMRLHQLQDLDKKTFQKYKDKYSPYGTIASLYLWEVAKNN